MAAQVMIVSTRFIAENSNNDKKVCLNFWRLYSCLIFSDVTLLDQYWKLS